MKQNALKRFDKLMPRAIEGLSQTPGGRFVLAARGVITIHGGRPTASIEGGRIVFTYPDGTKTAGGVTI